MRIQNITNLQSWQKLNFTSVYRVENGTVSTPWAESPDDSKTQELYDRLNKGQKRAVAIIDKSFSIKGNPSEVTYYPSLLLVDDKYGKEATRLKEIEDKFNAKKANARKVTGSFSEKDYLQAIRNASIYTAGKKCLYDESSKKTVVITMAQFNEILEKGFEAVVSKLKR